ncbi:MAG: helix-turn-helix transcriptional regulator [Clostridia bacterium]|nr:helix-turn-helix transcriptional regulator [Clostridia bacterium]
MAFKDKLKELREDKGMTQSELASFAGVTTRTLQNYEMGRSYPKNQAVVMKLCSVFGCAPSDLFSTEDEFVREATETYGSRGTAQAKSIIEQTSALFAGGGLNEDDREAFMQAIMEIYFDSKRKAKKYTPDRFK